MQMFRPVCLLQQQKTPNFISFINKTVWDTKLYLTVIQRQKRFGYAVERNFFVKLNSYTK